MAHQCLGCGAAFPDGSTDLLKGCPTCEGTRFFYTEEPLDEADRTELAERTEQDLQGMLKEVLESGERRNLNDEIWGKDAWEQWVRVERGEDGAAEASIPPPVSQDPVEEATPLEREAPAPEPEAPPEPARPSTLNIVEPGRYEIDVQRLMDDSPVIVERDGSYLIHLPSVFERAGK